MIFDSYRSPNGNVTMVGKTSSGNNGDIYDKKSPSSQFDGWALQITDGGNLLWTRCLGSGDQWDELRRIKDDKEGGMIAFGTTGGSGDSNDDIHQPRGSNDAFVCKLDMGGNPKLMWDGVASDSIRHWTFTHGSTASDRSFSGVVRPGGGFALWGASKFGGTYPHSSATSPIGDYDMWLGGFTDRLADSYHRGLGGTSTDYADDIVFLPKISCSTGGPKDMYFLLGRVSQTGRDVDVFPNTWGIWIALANESDGFHYNHWGTGINYRNGRVIRGTGSDIGIRSKLLTRGANAGHVMIVGGSKSNDVDFSGLNDWSDYDALAMIVRVTDGTVMAKQKFGGDLADIFYDFVELDDGSFIFVGQTFSNDTSAGAVPSQCPPWNYGGGVKSNGDGWIVKTNSSLSLL
jgi:hypothetical protein